VRLLRYSLQRERGRRLEAERRIKTVRIISLKVVGKDDPRLSYLEGNCGEENTSRGLGGNINSGGRRRAEYENIFESLVELGGDAAEFKERGKGEHAFGENLRSWGEEAEGQTLVITPSIDSSYLKLREGRRLKTNARVGGGVNLCI